MAKYRWPSDPQGKPPSHSISWQAHQANLFNQSQASGTAGAQNAQNAAQANAYQPGGSPAAPAPVAPPPPDWQQIAAESAATRGVQYADAQATYDRSRINRDFGYNAAGGVDPSNPYSRAALLERNFKQQQAGDTNSFADQGHLYSGALQNQKNETTFGYLSDRNTLRNQYSDANNDVTLGQLGAYSSAGGAVSQERINALLRALGQG